MFNKCRECGGRRHLIFRCGGRIIRQTSGVVDLDGCFPEHPSIEYSAGPGADDPAASAGAAFATARCWLVLNGPTGQEELWCILKDTNGIPQWHQYA